MLIADIARSRGRNWAVSAVGAVSRGVRIAHKAAARVCFDCCIRLPREGWSESAAPVEGLSESWGTHLQRTGSRPRIQNDRFPNPARLRIYACCRTQPLSWHAIKLE